MYHLTKNPLADRLPHLRGVASNYLQNASVVAFDFETAPDAEYRADPRASLDAHRAHIVGVSLSTAEGSAIYIPLRHMTGMNVEPERVIPYLRDALWTNPAVVKIAHNLAFESMFLYVLGIIVQPPCYDTIAAAQLMLKGTFEFRGLGDSGLKRLVPELLGDALPSFEDVTEGGRKPGGFPSRCATDFDDSKNRQNHRRFFDELSSHDPETVRYACADSDYALRLYHRFRFYF